MAREIDVVQEKTYERRYSFGKARAEMLREIQSLTLPLNKLLDKYAKLGLDPHDIHVYRPGEDINGVHFESFYVIVEVFKPPH